MFNQNITSNKFDLNLSTTLSSYWCTAIFYEIPLPALRFEKVEETDTKKWKRHRRETTPSKARQNQEAQRENDANDAQRKADSLARKRHAEAKTQRR